MHGTVRKYWRGCRCSECSLASARYQRRPSSEQYQQRKEDLLGKQAERRAYLSAHKAERGCSDCGYRANPVALDFDHRPGSVKAFSLGNVSNRSYKSIEAEIAKCDVVCANCHRIRTQQRRDTK